MRYLVPLLAITSLACASTGEDPAGAAEPISAVELCDRKVALTGEPITVGVDLDGSSLATLSRSAAFCEDACCNVATYVHSIGCDDGSQIVFVPREAVGAPSFEDSSPWVMNGSFGTSSREPGCGPSEVFAPGSVRIAGELGEEFAGYDPGGATMRVFAIDHFAATSEHGEPR